MTRRSYEIKLQWTGNDGVGTKTYTSYRRDHTISSAGKPEIVGSSDPAFRGDVSRYNPEELLVASASACHMLWYLHLCSANRITVLDYRDEPTGVVEEHADGAGAFVKIVLKPRVEISSNDDQARALNLHTDAHHHCLIARSVNFPIEVAAKIERQAAA